MEKTILELQNINKSFMMAKTHSLEKKSYIKALDNVSLTLGEGKVLGVVGESGSGKSTLGRVITKLLNPDSGKIIYNGLDVTNMNRREFKPFRKDIQMIFQNAYASLNPAKTIGWLLRESLELNGDFAESHKKFKIDEMMDMVGLRQVLKSRYPAELSGGERQRAAIGCALMPNPRIIVADEAVSALDVSVSAQILNLMNELKDRLNLSYIFISHDLGVVHYLSDEIAVLHHGQIIESGPAGEIFKNPGSDYTKELLAGTFIYSLPS